MIIEDPLEMGASVRSIIETNPLAQLLTKEQTSLNCVKQSYESMKQDTLDLKRRVNNSLVEQNVYKQLVRKSELKVKHLEKTVENSTSDFKCDFCRSKRSGKIRNAALRETENGSSLERRRHELPCW